MDTQWNQERAFGLYVHTTGGLEDMGVDFEVRDERGWLIGGASTFYGWDGERPCEFGHDPCLKAAEACRMAVERMRRDPLARPRVVAMERLTLWEVKS